MERDQWLTTHILCECWHEWDHKNLPMQWFIMGHDYPPRPEYVCNNCGQIVYDQDKDKPKKLGKRVDFSTWTGFGLLWEESNKRGWWSQFIKEWWFCRFPGMDDLITHIEPNAYADALYQFGQEHPELFDGKDK